MKNYFKTIRCFVRASQKSKLPLVYLASMLLTSCLGNGKSGEIQIYHRNGKDVFSTQEYKSESIEELCKKIDHRRSYDVSFKTKKPRQYIDSIVDKLKKEGITVKKVSSVSSVLKVEEKDRSDPLIDPFHE